MNFYGGRGGPLTVLLGLFIYAVVGICYVMFWVLALAVALLVLAGKGIRWLWQRHERNRRHGKHERRNAPTLPLPAVEYRDNHRS